MGQYDRLGKNFDVICDRVERLEMVLVCLVAAIKLRAADPVLREIAVNAELQYNTIETRELSR